MKKRIASLLAVALLVGALAVAAVVLAEGGAPRPYDPQKGGTTPRPFAPQEGGAQPASRWGLRARSGGGKST